MSKRCGSGNTDGSRLAAAKYTRTNSPRSDLGARHLDIVEGHPRGHLHRRVQPQDLFNSVGPQLRAPTQRVEMLGRVQQHANPVAQQVHCGLKPGGQHQSGDRLQFGLIEICFGRTAFRRLDQLAHQIVARGAPELPQVVGEPGAESSDPFLHAPVLRPRQSDVQTRRGQLTELQDVPPVLLGHAQDVADDRDRKLRAIPSNDVNDAGFAGQLIQQIGRGLFDPITQCGYRPGSEHRRHRLAIAGVVRRLNSQQRRCAQRMQKIVSSATLQPSHRCRQIRSERSPPGSRRIAAVRGQGRGRPSDR